MTPSRLQRASSAGGGSGRNMSADREAKVSRGREARSEPSLKKSKEEFRMVCVVHNELGVHKGTF